MKDVKKFKWLAGLLSLLMAAVWLTGCGDDNGRPGGGGGNGTNAPASIAGKTVNHTITGGSAPLPTSGSFVLQAQGNPGDTTGNYVLTGSGAVTNSTGTYTYTM